MIVLSNFIQTNIMSKSVGNYDLLQKLGRGSFADVYYAVHKVTHEKYALKVISKEKIIDPKNTKLQENLDVEIAIMRDYRHENIVCLYDHFHSSRYIYLVLELCPGGDLSQFIKNRGRLEEKMAYKFLHQLTRGLQFLDEKNIIHRDLKPANILLSEQSENAILKIADFGFARQLSEAAMAQTQCGTPLYMAPEIFENQEYDGKADIWSTGCIFYEMLTGLPPFRGINAKDLLNNIRTKALVIPHDIKLSQGTIALLREVLAINPSARSNLTNFSEAVECLVEGRPFKAFDRENEIGASSSDMLTSNSTTSSRTSTKKEVVNSSGQTPKRSSTSSIPVPTAFTPSTPDPKGSMKSTGLSPPSNMLPSSNLHSNLQSMNVQQTRPSAIPSNPSPATITFAMNLNPNVNNANSIKSTDIRNTNGNITNSLSPTNNVNSSRRAQSLDSNGTNPFLAVFSQEINSPEIAKELFGGGPSGSSGFDRADNFKNISSPNVNQGLRPQPSGRSRSASVDNTILSSNALSGNQDPRGQGSRSNSNASQNMHIYSSSVDNHSNNQAMAQYAVPFSANTNPYGLPSNQSTSSWENNSNKTEDDFVMVDSSSIQSNIPSSYQQYARSEKSDAGKYMKNAFHPTPQPISENIVLLPHKNTVASTGNTISISKSNEDDNSDLSALIESYEYASAMISKICGIGDSFIRSIQAINSSTPDFRETSSDDDVNDKYRTALSIYSFLLTFIRGNIINKLNDRIRPSSSPNPVLLRLSQDFLGIYNQIIIRSKQCLKKIELTNSSSMMNPSISRQNVKLSYLYSSKAPSLSDAMKDSNIDIPTAEPILYCFAMKLARDAWVENLLGNILQAGKLYSDAKLLLECLLVTCVDTDDTRILHYYNQTISRQMDMNDKTRNSLEIDSSTVYNRAQDERV